MVESEKINDLNEKNNFKNYIEERVNPQIKWFDEKSLTCQKWYKCLKIIEVGLTTLLPLVSFIPLSDYLCNKIILVVIGAVITFVRFYSELESYYELWIKYRVTAEALKREKWLFETSSGKYKNLSTQEAQENFVEQIEDVLSGEQKQWEAMIIHKRSNMNSGGENNKSSAHVKKEG